MYNNDKNKLLVGLEIRVSSARGLITSFVSILKRRMAKEIRITRAGSGNDAFARIRSGSIVFSFLLIMISFISIFAQKNDDVIRIDTDLVSFEVSITDKTGNPIRGLTVEDFNLFVDGEKRPISFFKPIKKNDVNRPLSVVFALDVSGSVTKEELNRLREAMQKFVKRLADYNSNFAVMTFGMKVKTIQSFTNRPDKLYRSFEKVLKDQDGLSTHAYDAVDDAIRLIRNKSPKSIGRQIPKRVVIVITDGYPVGDIVSPGTVIERANNAETSVYALILPSYSRLSMSNKPVLTLLEASGLTEKTGGRSFYANEKDLDPLFDALAEEITASYALSFYPENENVIDENVYEVEIKTNEEFIVKQNRLGFRLKTNK
ncbi:MAG: VWA domain-containing protein [Acidobacteria bacterium]|nr:VWA domain-containing protein [Acidobacteriota bacterium]